MLQLKRVEDNDVIILTGIKKRAFEAEFEKLGFTSEDMISKEWHERMMKNSIYYAILRNEEIIGGVNIFKGKNKEYYLCSIFIDSKLQNKGLGTQVIDILEQTYSDAKKWFLETPSMSVQNHHFYEKFGYIYVRDMVPNGAPEGFSLRVYEKTIN